RFMIIVKATPQTEAGVLPTTAELAAMGRFNEQLVKAGIMLAGEGLQDSSKGARVRFTGGKSTVIDGPFPESKELVAGYWIWQVKSRQEAIDWVRKAPFADGNEVEIRQVFAAEDFGADLTPELREQEERLGRQIREQQARKAAGKQAGAPSASPG
ncbi:MAG TPA: YciI family protein, partial [bacterium]|nr:YciI family protein [bacterium]